MQAIYDFFDAWQMNAEDGAAAIAGCVAGGASYVDPRSPDVLSGPDAIANYVAMFSANAPGWSARVVKHDETAGLHRVTVAFGGPGPDGKEMVQHGQYFIAANEAGHLTQLTGFVGTGAPE